MCYYFQVVHVYEGLEIMDSWQMSEKVFIFRRTNAPCANFFFHFWIFKIKRWPTQNVISQNQLKYLKKESVMPISNGYKK
jgi:hypothetical protein